MIARLFGVPVLGKESLRFSSLQDEGPAFGEYARLTDALLHSDLIEHTPLVEVTLGVMMRFVGKPLYPTDRTAAYVPQGRADEFLDKCLGPDMTFSDGRFGVTYPK